MTAGGEVTIEPATPADAEAIAAVFTASRRDALPYVPRPHAEVEDRRFIADVVLKRGVVRVARWGETPVGFVAVNGDTVEHLYLAPGWCRRGIGTRLMHEAKRLRPNGLRLHAFQRNAPTRAFYEGHGFAPECFGDGSDNEENEPDVLYSWRGRE